MSCTPLYHAYPVDPVHLENREFVKCLAHFAAICLVITLTLVFSITNADAAQKNARNAQNELERVLSASNSTVIAVEASESRVRVNSTATLVLDLQPQSGLSSAIDLWIIGIRGNTVCYLDIETLQFREGLKPTYQGAAFSLDKIPLPVIFREAGEYAIYFGIDTVSNGMIDFGPGELFFDTTAITVEAGTSNIITYLYNGDLYRISAMTGAAAENISTKLDAISAGADESINVSPNGEWYLISSERFNENCSGWPCLSLSNSDFSMNGAVIAGDALIHSEGPSAVSSDGKSIIYSSYGESHVRDLWLTTKNGENWSSPQLLTASSPYQYNGVPSVSDDGSSVLFECGDEPYMNKSICEINLDGSGFNILFRPDSQYKAARTPDYAPDGTVVAELDSNIYGEGIYRIERGSGRITLINPEFTNDNSPCVMSNGNIASLWLGRAGGNGTHELKIMDASGTGYFMLKSNIDIVDDILGCASW